MAVTARGGQARTEYRVVDAFVGPVPVTLLEARLDTGRTHQVRVHLAAIGHPVIGDDRYGTMPRPGPALMTRWRRGDCSSTPSGCQLDHPSGGRVTWEAPLPDDLAAVLAELST